MKKMMYLLFVFSLLPVVVANDMVDRIAADPAFGLTREEIVAGLVPENFGRDPDQQTGTA